MFWPNLISSGLAAPRKSATAACASSTIASDARLVVKAPPALAFAVAVVADDRVDHPLRDLRPAGPVEEHDRPAVLLAGERGELRPQGVDIEPGHRASSLTVVRERNATTPGRGPDDRGSGVVQRALVYGSRPNQTADSPAPTTTSSSPAATSAKVTSWRSSV